MIDHALNMMDSNKEDDISIADPDLDDAGVGGLRYCIKIVRDKEPNQQRKVVTCTRLDSRNRLHPLQENLPTTFLHYFKSLGKFDETLS